MKKLLAVLVVVALAIVAVSAADAAYIATTRHNLASGGSNTTKGNINEICVYCHTPHAGTQAAGQPLWNRFAGSTAGFTAYSSGTMSGTANAATNAASALCFSCHDGVTSINSLRNYNGAAYTGTNTVVSGAYNVGGDAASLTNDHPIGMPVPATKAGYKAPTALAGFLVSSNVECSTCHAVHGAGISNLLRISNTGSALCLDCHDK